VKDKPRREKKCALPGPDKEMRYSKRTSRKEIFVP